ncbi:DUF429 domain-containing protein [Nocardiopsis sp. NPDC049922]|uniref:DUF429 domain-containing protein n=1 Tax=Nocardiopsis sp. NPDC049922 TaxID=3155157 RepID=UPI0033F27239
MEVVGVDGCRRGWVAVHLRDGRWLRAGLHPDLSCVLKDTSAHVVAVDIPMGLLADGARACDGRIRGLLGPRANSVFPTPPRGVVQVEDFETANRLCRRLTGRGLSRQTFALFPKIREVDALRGEWGDRLYEVHPELSFRAMAGAPLRSGKRTWNGQALRMRLLADEGIVAPEDLAEAGEVPVDDVLDAAAAAWTAARIAAGRAHTCPDRPERDERGGPIAIWY